MSSSDLNSIVFDKNNGQTINPFDLFDQWYEKAKKTETDDAKALAFATVDSNGMPDVRILLMNAHDKRGFVVFMNLNSTKASQLKDNPKAAAVFHWKKLKQQIRIRGIVEQISDIEADRYFATRPHGSQIGAHASKQSSPLKNKGELLERIKIFEKKYPDIVPRPKHWSGYRIRPLEMEFWKDGKYRIHDRILFKRKSFNDKWTATRLNP